MGLLCVAADTKSWSLASRKAANLLQYEAGEDDVDLYGGIAASGLANYHTFVSPATQRSPNFSNQTTTFFCRPSREFFWSLHLGQDAGMREISGMADGKINDFPHRKSTVLSERKRSKSRRELEASPGSTLSANVLCDGCAYRLITFEHICPL